MFLLFIGDEYYPKGGWNDFRGGFSSISEALDSFEVNEILTWWHIVDFRNMEIVRSSRWEES